MKKSAVLALILALISVFSSAETNRKSAILWRPLPLVVAALYKLADAPSDIEAPILGELFSPNYEFIIEGQAAITETFSVSSIIDLAIGDTLQASMQIGPQLRPMGNYLKGCYLGFYPGIGYGYHGYSFEELFFTLNLETGYQWIYASGLVLGLSAGGLIIPPGDSKFYLSAQIGYAFKHLEMGAKSNSQ